jgi:hypothetical protein
MELPRRRRSTAEADDVDPRTGDLHARIAHLESSLQALEDSVYNDKLRHESEIAELRRLLEPPNMARALSDDARRRGL